MTEDDTIGSGELGALLRPSLKPDATAEPLYSLHANFMVAFFGGVYGAAIFTAINTRRMRRLRQDGWIMAIAIVAWTVVLFWAGQGAATDSLPDWLGRDTSTIRHAGRAGGLLLLGLHYLRAQRFYKTQLISGVEPPGPWSAGLGAVGAGILVTLVVVWIAMTSVGA